MSIAKIFLMSLLIGLCGCAANDALTPSSSLKVDDFDGTKMIYQPPVSAAASMMEGWNMLGMSWSERLPNEVILIAGASNAAISIKDAMFNVDGTIITAKPTGDLTSREYFDSFKLPPQSTKPFIISLEDFVLLANAKTVKMRITTYKGESSTSTFGSDHPNAIVQTKLQKFLANLKEAKAI